MNESERGFLGATLSGVALHFSVQGPAERLREIKTVHEGGPGGVREHLAWQLPGYPIRTRKRSWSFSSQNAREQASVIEELLAGPGPHRWCFWKRDVVAWLGDGARLEFFLPHDLIIGDSAVAAALTETPHGSLSDYEPLVKVGLAGTPLTFESVESGDYATGPGAGEVYFLNGGARFKLEAAPAAGALVFARYVPYYAVLERGETERRYADNAREPRALELVEL